MNLKTEIFDLFPHSGGLIKSALKIDNFLHLDYANRGLFEPTY